MLPTDLTQLLQALQSRYQCQELYHYEFRPSHSVNIPEITANSIVHSPLKIKLQDLGDLKGRKLVVRRRSIHIYTIDGERKIAIPHLTSHL